MTDEKPFVGESGDALRAAMARPEPWSEVFRGKPDLIASDKADTAAVLFKMSRRHANILGAYLNGRNDIAPLPELVQEVLEALTLRLVSPPGSRWNDLRQVLNGQPAILRPHQVDWVPLSQRQSYEGRRRRPYTTPTDDPDLRADLRLRADEEPGRDDHLQPGWRPDNTPPALLGDADGTTMAEWPQKEGD